MKNYMWMVASAIAVSVVAGGAGMMAGCTQDVGTPTTRPDVASLKEGLNIIDVSDPSWGMDVAYKKDGHVIYYSSRVGPLKAEGYRKAWPDDPQYEMDARYVDENGDTFALRIGGDTFIDPTWAKDIQAGHASNLKFDPALRATSFALANEVSGAIQAEVGKTIPATFKDHVLHAQSLGQVKLPEVSKAELDAKVQEMKALDKPYSTDGDWNYWYVQQYSGSVTYVPFYPSGCSQLAGPIGGCGSQQEAYHTAERFWNDRWNNGSQYWSMYIDACNHGRCAWDGLTYTAARWGNAGWIWNNQVDVLWLQSANWDNSGTGVNGACQTSYSWASGSGSHLCNDDSAFEVWQMDNNSTGNGTYNAWSTTTYNYRYTSYYTFSCTTNDSTAKYACDGAYVYRDWLPPCPF